MSKIYKCAKCGTAVELIYKDGCLPTCCGEPMVKVETKTEKPAFAPGDKVSVVSGIFEGYNGTLQEINTEDDSATVLVSTETRDMQIIVDLKDIVRDKED